jgi:hypothetical protein
MKMLKITVNQLNRILVDHQKYVDSFECDGVRADLTDVDLRYVAQALPLVAGRGGGAGLMGVELSGAKLTGANLSGLNLSNTSFRSADLRDTVFNGSTLRGADLRNGDARGASFYRCELALADFRGARLEGASFVGSTYVDATSFEDAAIYGAMFGNVGAVMVDCTPFAAAEKKKKKEKENTMELSEEEWAVITKMRVEKAEVARRTLVLEVVGRVVEAAQTGRDIVCMPTSIDLKSFESVKRIMDIMGLCAHNTSDDFRSFTFKVRKE